MAKFIAQGKFDDIGLSEVRTDLVRQASRPQTQDHGALLAADKEASCQI